MATAELFRGFTHPVTNLTNLGTSDARALLAGLMQGRLDESLFFSFIHEATHHWCFATPLGEALSIVHFRPMLTMAEWAEGPDNADDSDEADDVRYRVGDDLLAYDQVVGLLRPVIEGMAVFAEYDLVPDLGAEVMSHPLQSTLFLFCRDELREALQAGGDPARVGDEVLYEFLLRLRTTTGVKRKAGLLAEPLRDVRRGHLAGYLFVKNLWAHVGCNGRRLSADEFLRFLHSYFFSDLRMVHELLVPDDGVTDRFQRVTAAFNDRIQALVDGSAEKYVESLRAYDRQRTQGKTLGEALYAFFAEDGSLTLAPELMPPVNTTETAALGLRLLQETLEELRNSTEPLHQSIAWSLARRDRIRLVGADVRVSRSSSDRIAVTAEDGQLLLAGRTVEGCALPNGEHDGQVDAYYVPTLAVSYVTVSVDGDVVLLYPSSKLSKLMEEQVGNYTQGGVEELRQLEAIRLAAREFAIEETAMSVFLPAVPAELDTWYQEAIVPTLFPRLSPSSRAEVLRRLEKTGLFALCDSANDLRALAWLSIVGSDRMSLDLAERVFEATRPVHAISGSLDELLARLAERSERLLRECVVGRDGDVLTSLA